MRNLLRSTAALALAASMTAPAAAQELEEPGNLDEGEWVSLTGYVASVDETSFHLEYPGGNIEVEFEDIPGDPNEDRLFIGQEVTAYGYIDDDFLEGHVLEAQGFFVNDWDTYYGVYYTGWPSYAAYDWGDELSTVISLEGEVTSIDGREFTLDVNGVEFSVDTMSLVYNPLDDVGYPRVDEGDRVSVSGVVEQSLFDETELSATSIVTL